MLTSSEKRKSPCCLAAHTGWDSCQNLKETSSSYHSMSIHRARSIAKIILGWVREAQRLRKEARDTKREIHAIALERQLAGISEQIGRFC